MLARRAAAALARFSLERSRNVLLYASDCILSLGSDDMAPKAMQLNNMVVMKRRTRDLPVPLLMFTNVLDNYGEHVLFQPWDAFEELTSVRTEEEWRERRRRQLELFPMAVFPREGAS